LVTPRAHVEAHVALIQVYRSDKFSELVFSRDEDSSSDSEDGTPKKTVARDCPYG
jgi:hypothetical protein